MSGWVPDGARDDRPQAREPRRPDWRPAVAWVKEQLRAVDAREERVDATGASGDDPRATQEGARG